MIQPFVLYAQNYKGINDESSPLMSYKRWSRPSFMRDDEHSIRDTHKLVTTPYKFDPTASKIQQSSHTRRLDVGYYAPVAETSGVEEVSTEGIIIQPTHTGCRGFILTEARTCINPCVPCILLFSVSMSTPTLKSSHKP
jgi:hypothetical protein